MYIANPYFYILCLIYFMKKIDGGCTITVGHCLKDGSYFIAAVKNKCGSYNTHKKQALNAAKGSYFTFNY